MDIFIPKNIPLRIPKTQVQPNVGDMHLDCGRCGSRVVRLHIEPVEDQAMIKELVCDNCQKVWKIDNESKIEASGKVTLNGKELIDDNPKCI